MTMVITVRNLGAVPLLLGYATIEDHLLAVGSSLSIRVDPAGSDVVVRRQSQARGEPSRVRLSTPAALPLQWSDGETGGYGKQILYPRVPLIHSIPNDSVGTLFVVGESP